MLRLNEWLTRFGPCVWLATCGLLVDLWTGVWGPGFIVGGRIGLGAGHQRWRAEQNALHLSGRSTDGLNGLYEPEPLEDWELEETWELEDDEAHALKGPTIDRH